MVVICILLIGLNIYTQFMHQKEKTKLLDRIQAGTLAEYKAFEVPKPKKDKEEKENEPNWL